MSRTAIPTSAVLAFGPPVVKAGALVLPVHIHGNLHGLSAPLIQWKNAAIDILRRIGPELLAESGDPEAIPARVALYEAALADVRSGKTPAAAAAAHDLPLGAFERWLETATTHGAPREPAACERAPVLKPNQHIL